VRRGKPLTGLKQFDAFSKPTGEMKKAEPVMVFSTDANAHNKIVTHEEAHVPPRLPAFSQAGASRNSRNWPPTSRPMDYGIRSSVTTAKFLDGRNRLAACRIAKVKPRFVEWDGTGSPLQWVISENLIRRHLTSSQRP